MPAQNTSPALVSFFCRVYDAETTQEYSRNTAETIRIDKYYIIIYTINMEVYCPFCESKKPMVKAGKACGKDFKVLTRYQCKNKICGRFTVKPLKEK